MRRVIARLKLRSRDIWFGSIYLTLVRYYQNGNIALRLSGIGGPSGGIRAQIVLVAVPLNVWM